MTLKTLARQFLDAAAEQELTMVDAVERLPDLQRALNIAREDTLTLEKLLKQRCVSIPATVGDIAWGPVGRSYRVLYKGRPLLETSMHERLEGFVLVPDLVREIGHQVELFLKDFDRKCGFTA